MANKVRGCQAHPVPKVLRDPGDYDRGGVVNGGEDSPPEQPGYEWAGNSPGWQGMPRALGQSPRGGQQDQISHASIGKHPTGPNQDKHKEVDAQSYHSPDQWEGNLGEPNSSQEPLGYPDPINTTIKAKFNK